ncbi:tetratricopeptide repeat protein [Cohnella phaseoli]|uniref:Tetratricopeptide repeat protein n=1 Tax=Cohnella phaseoli TaxID=456490 RepID=A0A3D9IQI3_9BACL|nr:hypothetical protein [Cohnella phaseoli]RED63346.1 hypothetical protein DFP98_12622 [Cohnella phaseoli]
MKIWRKWLLGCTLALFAFSGLGLSHLPSAAAAGESESAAFESISLAELEDGTKLYEKIAPFITEQIQLLAEDAVAITASSIYEVDLGNYPKGFTRQFISFIHNYEWIELVLVASNEDASSLKLLDRAATSESGDMFLNTAKLDYSTEGNMVYVWSQAPYSAFESWIELEWAGDSFYVVNHEYADPTESYYEEKAALLKAKDIEGLIAQTEFDFPQYPWAYEAAYTLAAPTLKLAHQKAMQQHKAKNTANAIRYLEYGLTQYGDAFGILDYGDGKLAKETIVGSADSDYVKSRLTLGAYVGILNDYGFFLSLTGNNKKAKLVLANVVKLVPSRTVAYLNLADVEWSLGQKSAAKSHYKIYWKQLGAKASSVAPKRVQERINAK